MKGEFVGVDGTIYSVVGCRVHVTKFGFKTIDPYHPDFATAVAALQALIQPKQAVPLAGVHPGVGLRWCGEEEAFERDMKNVAEMVRLVCSMPPCTARFGRRWESL